MIPSFLKKHTSPVIETNQQDISNMENKIGIDQKNLNSSREVLNSNLIENSEDDYGFLVNDYSSIISKNLITKNFSIDENFEDSEEQVLASSTFISKNASSNVSKIQENKMKTNNVSFEKRNENVKMGLPSGVPVIKNIKQVLPI